MKEDKMVICGANAYEQKYYFNEKQYGKLPQSIKDELHIMCVLFTEEVGGIITIAFDEDGGINIGTQSDPEDYYYDDISSGLLVGKIRQHREDLFEALSMYYRVFVLHEQFDGINNLKDNSEDED